MGSDLLPSYESFLEYQPILQGKMIWPGYNIRYWGVCRSCIEGENILSSRHISPDHSINNLSSWLNAKSAGFKVLTWKKLEILFLLYGHKLCRSCWSSHVVVCFQTVPNMHYLLDHVDPLMWYCVSKLCPTCTVFYFYGSTVTNHVFSYLMVLCDYYCQSFNLMCLFILL